MAALSIKIADIKDVSTYPITLGQFVYCPDATRAFYDAQTDVRIEIDFVAANTLEDLVPDESIPNMVYFTRNDSKFYKHNTYKFIELVTSEDVGELYDMYKLTPFTIESTLDGVKLAPRTLANSVYTETGETVEERLQYIYKTVRMITDVAVTTNYQKVFNITIPFDGYFENGNILDVYLNGILLDEADYSIDVTAGRLTLSDDVEVHTDDALKYNFIYNAYVNTQDEKRIIALDASYLADGSITVRKIKHVSNSINLDDANSLATSKAVYDLHASLIDKINEIAPTRSYLGEATEDSYSTNLITKIQNFELNDSTEIFIRIPMDMEDNATITINNMDPIPIMVNGTVITSKLDKEQVVSLVYNATNEYFNVKICDYKVVSYNYRVTMPAGETKIPFDIPKFVKGETLLHVYQNNLRLFAGVNYILRDNEIELINYTTDEDDFFYFEVEVVERVV